jgi:hypothetical protein
MANVNENKKGTYIPSIEAEKIYDMSVRGLEDIMDYDYIGFIPYSLEIRKLRTYKKLFAQKEIIKNKKVQYFSDAVINIKFKNKIRDGKEITSFVRDYDKLLSRLKSQFKSINKSKRKNKIAIQQSKNKREIEKLEKKVVYLINTAQLVLGHIKRIKVDKENNIFEEMKAPELREFLYVNGFTFMGKKYVFYKRTASKSRQSQALFILEELYQPMKEWSHMGLDLNGKVDVGSLLAYESLVSSSLQETIKIYTENIFIIPDKFSEFEMPAIEVGNDLKPIPNDNAKIVNNIWDGQGLIDISLMESIGQADKGMILTRQHFWKSCLFTTHIQKWLQDKHEELTNPDNKNYDASINPDYNNWQIKDAFGIKHFVNQILLISTPSSIKFLKYAKKGKEKEAYINWTKRVKKDGYLFGVCKHEKSSKYDDRSYTSYQMINTLDADMDDIKKLAEFEVNYIQSLQGIQDEYGNINDKPFIDYLDKKKELTNAYEMFSELYKINPDIVRTQMFRDYRTRQISNYRTKIKGGKLRLEADYCTVISNPIEMLEAVIEGKGMGNKINKPSVLKVNEIYTTLHNFGEEYTLVRNPHNAANNFFRAINVDNEVFKTYFNFTKNIVVINSIKSPILAILNGMDMDSDQALIFKGVFNEVINKTFKNRKYPLILNTIVSLPDPVELTNKNIAKTDTKTAKSQMWIGEVTNSCQYQVSVLHHIIRTENDTKEREKKIDEILGNIAVTTVLSNVAIDYSKKIVEVDIDKALRGIRKSEATKVYSAKSKKLVSRKKPMFWTYVSSSKPKTEEFNCPMDLLIKHIDNDIPKAIYRNNLPLEKLLTETNQETLGEDHQQIKDIINLVEKFEKDVKSINANNEDKKCQERQTKLQNAFDELDEKIGKKKIRKATMYKMLTLIAESYKKKEETKNITNDFSGIVVYVLNALYRNHGKTFLNLFEKY